MALNPLDPLTAALQRKSQATAKLEGVNEDYSRATALRDQDLMGAYNPKLGNYGTGDLGTVLRGVESIMAGNKAKELKPQRMAARQEVANTENALPLWNAERMLEKEATEKSKYDAEQLAEAAKEATEKSRYDAEQLAKDVKEAKLDARYEAEQKAKNNVDDGNAEKKLRDALDNLDLYESTLIDSNLMAGTGTNLDPLKLFSDFTGLMPDAQYASTKVQNLAINAIKPMLESGAFGKISNDDVKLMLSTVNDASKEPLGLIKSLEDIVLPNLKGRLRDQGQEHLIPIVEDKIQGIIKQGYKAQYPKRFAEIYGAEVAKENNPNPLTAGWDAEKKARFELYKKGL